jgi:hypothetical protein
MVSWLRTGVVAASPAEGIMVDAQLVARLRHEAQTMQPPGFDAPLAAIEALAYEIGCKAPSVLAQASEILAFATIARAARPSRDEIAEAIEEVCGDELSACCVNRIAEAVMRLCRVR